jgi:hypothetical protein
MKSYFSFFKQEEKHKDLSPIEIFWMWQPIWKAFHIWSCFSIFQKTVCLNVTILSHFDDLIDLFDAWHKTQNEQNRNFGICSRFVAWMDLKKSDVSWIYWSRSLNLPRRFPSHRSTQKPESQSRRVDAIHKGATDDRNAKPYQNDCQVAELIHSRVIPEWR